LEKYSESSSSVVERNALRKMVLLRWSVGAVGAGSVPGGAVGIKERNEKQPDHRRHGSV
jgi:hypothetical protein